MIVQDMSIVRQYKSTRRHPWILSGKITMPTIDSPGLGYFYSQARWTQVRLKFPTYMRTLCSMDRFSSYKCWVLHRALNPVIFFHQVEELPVRVHQVSKGCSRSHRCGPFQPFSSGIHWFCNRLRVRAWLPSLKKLLVIPPSGFIWWLVMEPQRDAPYVSNSVATSCRPRPPVAREPLICAPH